MLRTKLCPLNKKSITLKIDVTLMIVTGVIWTMHIINFLITFFNILKVDTLIYKAYIVKFRKIYTLNLIVITNFTL